MFHEHRSVAWAAQHPKLFNYNETVYEDPVGAGPVPALSTVHRSDLKKADMGALALQAQATQQFLN